MATDWYSPSGWPATNAPGASSPARAEFALIQTAMNKLPAITGATAGAAVVINGSGTALTTTTGALALAGNLTTTGAFNTTFVQQATATFTLPAATDTLVGRASTDTLTNKTFDTAGAGNVFKINGTAISANTGTGSNVLATSPTITTPTISGHFTAEGVTTTGATGTGNLVFATSPTFGGSITVANSAGMFGDASVLPYGMTASHQAQITGANSNNYSVNLQNTTTGTTQQVAQLQLSAAAPNNGTAWFWQCIDSLATRGTFLSNGGLANFSANNTNLSDARVKPSFEQYTNEQLDALQAGFCAVDWGRFKYEDQSHDDWNHGYTAQGVQKAFADVAPELVDTWVDGKHLAVYNEDLKNISHALLARLLKDVAELKSSLGR